MLKCEKRCSGKIIIGYIGYLREYDYLIELTEKFGADSRFEFHVHGSGDCVDRLSDYSKGFKNIKVFGAYDERDKMRCV